MEQRELTLRIVTVLEPGQPVIGPVVYSTNPRKAPALGGRDFFLKGPEPNVVVPEIIAYLLARVVNLSVPPFGIAPLGEALYFASEEIHYRNVEGWITRGAIANPQVLVEAVAFDIWVANHDRNMGNFVGELTPDSRAMRLYAIDFEKSEALRGPYPIVSVAQIEPRKFWPREDLANFLKGRKPPTDFCDRVASVRKEQVVDCFTTLSAHIPGVPWAENSIKLLADRARNIHRHVKEAWR